MVKISELIDDNNITGTEQVPLNDGGTTKKATVDDILAKQHDHTVSDVTDFDTAVEALIDVPTDTAKTTPVDTDVFALWDAVRKKVTWANIKATLKTYFDTLYHPLNGLRTGLTANQILTTNGSGEEGYTALSTLPVVASDAEVTTGTDEVKFTNSKQVRVNSRATAGNTQRSASASTGTQNIAHGLGQAPRLVEVYYAERDSPSTASNFICMGTYDGTTNQTLGLVDIGATAEIRLSTSNILVHQDSSGNGWTATATFDATNIILSRTKTSSGQNIDLIWKAHA